MPPPRVKISIDGGADATSTTTILSYARLKGVIAPSWELGAIPPASSSFDRYLTALPFAFGRLRSADSAQGIVDHESGWQVIESTTCSRTHAVLRFDEASQQFMLKSLSGNGVDVNQRHVGKDEEVPLPSKSTLRIGPMYAMFFLPKENAVPPPLAPPAAEGGAGAASKPRARVAYSHVLDAVYAKHFSTFGCFTAHDMARLAHVEFPTSGLADDVDKLRAHLQKSLNSNYNYEAVAAEDVPAAAKQALAAGHAGKKVSWYRKLSAEVAASRKQADKAKAAAAAGAGAGEGGEDVVVLG